MLIMNYFSFFPNVFQKLSAADAWKCSAGGKWLLLTYTKTGRELNISLKIINDDLKIIEITPKQESISPSPTMLSILY